MITFFIIENIENIKGELIFLFFVRTDYETIQIYYIYIIKHVG